MTDLSCQGLRRGAGRKCQEHGLPSSRAFLGLDGHGCCLAPWHPQAAEQGTDGSEHREGIQQGKTGETQEPGGSRGQTCSVSQEDAVEPP